MHKLSNFEGRIITNFVEYEDEAKCELFSNIGRQYGFSIDYDCGTQFYVAKDNIYENLKSRMIFILKRLKEEKFEIINYNITATVFNSKTHGELI